MVIAFSSMGFAFHPSNLTSSGSQSFAETQGDSKGRSPWRAFGDFPRDGKVTRVQGGAPASRGGAQRMGRSPSSHYGREPRVLKLLYPSRREKTTAFGRRWAVEKQTAAAVKKKEQKKRAASRYRKKSKNRSKNNVDNLIIPALPPKIKPFFQIFPSFLPDAPKSPLWKSWVNRRGISVKNKKKD